MLLSIANSRPRNMESVGVEGLYPSALRESASSLISFIERYYEYLNTSGLPSNEIANITRDKDIDIVSNKYLTEIQSLIARNIPNSRAIDKVTLYRIIIQYYRTRGSEDSIHTFFKIFFDEIVDIFYPRDYLFDLSNGVGSWAPLNISSLRRVYTNPNKVTLKITSDYRIGPFPLSDNGPYVVTLTAISKNLWTYGGREKSSALPYVEKTNIADDGQPPVYRWVYRYSDKLELFSTDNTTWPDEATWQALSKNIEFSTLPGGISLLESGSAFNLENDALALLESAIDGEEKITSNIEYGSLTIVPSTGGTNDPATDVQQHGIITEENVNLVIETPGNDVDVSLVTELSGGSDYITEFKNIEYYHIFEVKALQQYATKIGEFVHSLEDVADPENTPGFIYSKVYRTIDLDPITWIETDKNQDVWTYESNQSFASDVYKLHDGEYWQKYSYRIRCRLPQEDWVNDYLRFVHPAGLKLFSAILHEFISRTFWVDKINYEVKKPQDSYVWLDAYNPPKTGYHTPRYQPGWLSGNERLLTIILEYLKSRGSEDDFIRLITYAVKLFLKNSNPRNKTIHDDYQSWLKYLDPNELICGIADKTIEEANLPWLETRRNLFTNISSFINFRIRDKSYYPWFYSELIPLDAVYEDTDPQYFEATIQTLYYDETAVSDYNFSDLSEKEELIYRYPLEKQDGDGYFINEEDEPEPQYFITEGQTNLKTITSFYPNKPSVKENEIVRFYAFTKHIQEGTTLYWSVSSQDVLQSSGTCVVKNGVAVFKVVPLASLSSGDDVTLTAAIRQASQTGLVLAQSIPVTVQNNTAIPTYTITTAVQSTIEGGAIPFTITTTDVDDNEALYYVSSLPNDCTPPSGGVVIRNNTAAFTLIATPDTLDNEGTETFNVKLYACGSAVLSVATSPDVDILDAYKLWEFFPVSSTLSGLKVKTSGPSLKIAWTDGSLEEEMTATSVTNEYTATHNFTI